MAIEVEIIGNGKYAGAKANVGSYSVSEESTPIEASDSSGGTGQITFSAIDDASMFGSVLLLNDTVKLNDGDRGEIIGKINSITSNNGVLSVTADAQLGRTVIDRATTAMAGTAFTTALNYYLSLAGIPSGDIAIDSSLTGLTVSSPGTEETDLWTLIKQIMVVSNAEIALVRGKVVIRPIRQRRALEINNVEESWTVSNTDLAQRVEVNYYNTQWMGGGLIYPKGGWNEDVTVYTVDAGQTLEVNIPIDMYIYTINQPPVQSNVTREQTTQGYAVAGNDGLPIVPAQWTADGGSLSVAIGADKKSIDLKVVGAAGNTARYAPYRIAVSAGPSDYYSSLRITGSGWLIDQKTLTVPTGVDTTTTNRQVGVTVDNIFVQTEQQARDIALEVAAKWASPVRTISITKSNINKPGETDTSYDYATFAQADARFGTQGVTTFAQFDTAYSGQTFEQFDDYWYGLVQDGFDYQVFGNANGARVQFRRAMYRIRSATITDSNVTYEAEADTTFADFDESASIGGTMTFAQFDTLYSGMTFNDFALVPLPKALPEYDR